MMLSKYVIPEFMGFQMMFDFKAYDQNCQSYAALQVAIFLWITLYLPVIKYAYRFSMPSRPWHCELNKRL